MAQFVALPKDRFFKYKKGCDTMVYTDEVRKKLDAILKAFEKYIDGQSYIYNTLLNEYRLRLGFG